ncbi:hypothetical protein AFLA70_260g001149, partial [Aspergillus flavus AF70]
PTVFSRPEDGNAASAMKLLGIAEAEVGWGWDATVRLSLATACNHQPTFSEMHLIDSDGPFQDKTLSSYY